MFGLFARAAALPIASLCACEEEIRQQPCGNRSPPLPSTKRRFPTDDKKLGRIFLIDTFGFVFRAYHAMARQRPMSTKTGIPTSATYVFVNMLNKLRQDFAPEYIAAIFEGGPTFRDVEAKEVTAVRKFDSKTQTFQDIAYGGYKANRAEMPEDLAQQMPYIERALDAYRIPMISARGLRGGRRDRHALARRPPTRATRCISCRATRT